MKQMILEIDEGAEFDDMPADLQAAIQKAGISWPESIMIGTSPVLGKQLTLITCGVDKDELIDLMNTDEIDEDGIQIKFNLGWSIVACEGEPINQALLLPYFNDAPTFDELGEQIGVEPVTDLTGKLQTWSGRKWTF